jgi:hypothetical protein
MLTIPSTFVQYKSGAAQEVMARTTLVQTDVAVEGIRNVPR